MSIGIPFSFSGVPHVGLVCVDSRANRAGHRMQRLNAILLGFLLVMVVAAAQAQSPNIDRSVKVNLRSAGYVPIGRNDFGTMQYETRANFDARWNDAMGGSASRNFTKQAAISGTTVGQLGRKALRGGVYGAAIGLAVEGIIDGAGWAIGELQDQVLEPGTPREELGATAICIFSGANRRCASSRGQLSAVAHNDGTGNYAQPCVPATSGSTTGYRCIRVGTVPPTAAFNVAEDVVTKPTTGWPSGSNANPGTDDVPITDTQLGDKIKEHPDVVNGLLQDPRTGRPVVTPEFQQQMDDIKRMLETELDQPHSGDGTANLDDDTRPDDISPMAGEWPGFCSWATVVCDFIDWVKAPEPETETPEVPFDETFVEQDWSSGIGGGSCPGDVSFTVTLSGASASPSFSYEPICQFATTMRPVIIAMALILVPMLVGGFRGSKDA